MLTLLGKGDIDKSGFILDWLYLLKVYKTDRFNVIPSRQLEGIEVFLNSVDHEILTRAVSGFRLDPLTALHLGSELNFRNDARVELSTWGSATERSRLDWRFIDCLMGWIECYLASNGHEQKDLRYLTFFSELVLGNEFNRKPPTPKSRLVIVNVGKIDTNKLPHEISYADWVRRTNDDHIVATSALCIMTMMEVRRYYSDRMKVGAKAVRTGLDRAAERLQKSHIFSDFAAIISSFQRREYELFEYPYSKWHGQTIQLEEVGDIFLQEVL